MSSMLTRLGRPAPVHYTLTPMHRRYRQWRLSPTRKTATSSNSCSGTFLRLEPEPDARALARADLHWHGT
jgi:hypothetical protein